MITKFNKGTYYLVLATDDNGNPNGNLIRIKGQTTTYSSATMQLNSKVEWEEVE